jgi:hypothetical protein
LVRPNSLNAVTGKSIRKKRAATREKAK